MAKTKIIDIRHPDYTALTDSWTKFRLTYEAGDAFIEEYLKSFSEREDTTDLDARKEITFVPAYSKAVILDIKNSIYQRMVDITRKGGPKTYIEAINGQSLGVDLRNRRMDDYVGDIVLPELLSMGKVGVFVDKPAMDAVTKADTIGKRPYLYKYKAEDILSWDEDLYGELTSLLVRKTSPITDVEYGLVSGTVKTYLHFLKTETGVSVTEYNADSEQINAYDLQIKYIPLVVFELSQSLLTDVCNHQIALLNMSSSDVNFIIKANFPFYTEQYVPGVAALQAMSEGTLGLAATKEIEVGVTKGRAYSKGLERPGFINPSAEPLLASMKKQEDIKREIRQLINLSLQNLEPKEQSAESKDMDNKGLEAGLAYIGFELARGERQIARVWADYEASNDYPTVIYPRNYSLRTEDDRRAEAKDLKEQMSSIPSVTFQKTVAKEIATTLVGHKVKPDVLEKIHAEIEAAKIVDTDPERIRQDHEEGLVGDELASQLLGYPNGEHIVAQKDKAERAKIIAIAQSSATYNAAARGNSDGSPDPKEQAGLEKSNELEVDKKQQRGDEK